MLPMLTSFPALNEFLTMETPLVAIVTGAVSLLLLQQATFDHISRTEASAVPSVLRWFSSFQVLWFCTQPLVQGALLT